MYADLNMQADLLKEARGKKYTGRQLPDRGLLANHERINAARWPKMQWRCVRQESPLPAAQSG
jgi:hypothetical protein